MRRGEFVVKLCLVFFVGVCLLLFIEFCSFVNFCVTERILIFQKCAVKLMFRKHSIIGKRISGFPCASKLVRYTNCYRK